MANQPTKQEQDAADAKAKVEQDAAEAARLKAEQDAADAKAAEDAAGQDDGELHGVQEYRVMLGAVVLRVPGKNQGQRFTAGARVTLNADDEDVQKLIALGALELFSGPNKGRQLTAHGLVQKANAFAQENGMRAMPDGQGAPFRGDTADLDNPLDEDDEK